MDFVDVESFTDIIYFFFNIYLTFLFNEYDSLISLLKETCFHIYSDILPQGDRSLVDGYAFGPSVSSTFSAKLRSRHVLYLPSQKHFQMSPLEEHLSTLSW